MCFSLLPHTADHIDKYHTNNDHYLCYIQYNSTGHFSYVYSPFSLPLWLSHSGRAPSIPKRLQLVNQPTFNVPEISALFSFRFYSRWCLARCGRMQCYSLRILKAINCAHANARASMNGEKLIFHALFFFWRCKNGAVHLTCGLFLYCPIQSNMRWDTWAKCMGIMDCADEMRDCVH